MRAVFFWCMLYNAIVVVWLFVYFPLVFLNLVFPFSDLPISDVSYYNGNSGNYDRYAIEWFIYASDIFRFIPPLLLTFTLTQALLDTKSVIGILTFYMIFNTILAILELVKAIKYTWDWIYCKDYQFCRSFDSDDGGNPNDANYVFITVAITSYVYLIFDIIYLILSRPIKTSVVFYERASLFESNGDDMESGNKNKNMIHLRIESSHNNKVYDDDDDNDPTSALKMPFTINHSEKPHKPTIKKQSSIAKKSSIGKPVRPVKKH
jgi:hypothetical protein